MGRNRIRRGNRCKPCGAFGFACLLIGTPARADEGDVDSGVLPLEIHGFVSQGFIKTTDNNYLAKSEQGSFEFTEVGINFTKSFTDRLRVGIQLFARDLGPLGQYRPQFDWYYLDYRFEDWFGIRAGRTKLPFGLYNETSDIDAARVPVLLPQSVYPVANRDFLLAQTGGEIYGNVPLGDAGSLEYRGYGGTIYLASTTIVPPSVTNTSVPYLAGGRLMWMTPLEGLQAGGSLQTLRLDFDYTLPPAQLAQLQMAGVLPADSTGTLHLELPAILWVGSMEYQADDLLLAAEYSRWSSKVESSVPGIFPDTTTTSERFYGMASYRINPWFTPGIYYSVFFPNVDNRHGRENYQHDVSGTLRFDFNSHWLLKLEGHYMHGTAGLSSSLNDNQPLSALTKDWGAFFVKTTAYF